MNTQRKLIFAYAQTPLLQQPFKLDRDRQHLTGLHLLMRCMTTTRRCKGSWGGGPQANCNAGARRNRSRKARTEDTKVFMSPDVADMIASVFLKTQVTPSH